MPQLETGVYEGEVLGHGLTVTKKAGYPQVWMRDQNTNALRSWAQDQWGNSLSQVPADLGWRTRFWIDFQQDPPDADQGSREVFRRIGSGR